MDEHKSKCGCPCHMAVGAFVVLFGVTFLLGATGMISQECQNITWPIFVILIGLKKMFAGKCKCCANK